MSSTNTVINDTVLGIAGFGTSAPSSTAQVSVTPLVSAVGVTTGMLVQPIFTSSSATVYGQLTNPAFNPPSGMLNSAYGIHVSSSVNSPGSGTVSAVYGLKVTGLTVSSGTAVNAASLFVANANGAGTIVNDYTAVLGSTPDVRVGVGTPSPRYTLSVEGSAAAERIDGYASGRTADHQLIELAQGFNHGYGSGFVGANKQVGANTSTVFDLTAVQAAGNGFNGGVCDGRYVYLVPYFAGGSYSGTVVRYDTTRSFNAPESYTLFDTTIIDASSRGFAGGLFDGRYLYLIPNYNGASNSGTMTRYDTTLSFHAPRSYTVFDMAAVDAAGRGFSGGVYDGRYAYLAPNANSTITRYDTTLSFTSAGSYTVLDARILHTQCTGFSGGAFDGRHVYFTPNGFSIFLRYDTALSFTNTASYTVYDVGFSGFNGGVFDGRYVYLTPNNDGAPFGTIVRYDTGNSFTAAASYTAFDVSTVAVAGQGFYGGVFDGRYLYLPPNDNGGASGTVVSYDTTQSFFSAASYTSFDTTLLHSNSKGFRGAVFDGRYVYFAPYNQQILTRIDAYAGSPATAIAAASAPNGFAVGTYAGQVAVDLNSLIISGNVGVGVSNPSLALEVSGTLKATSISVGTLNVSSAVNNALTTNNQQTAISQGYNQGGWGGGSVGTNKTMSGNSTTVFDMTGASALAKGFQGGVFDGRYVYFVPDHNGVDYSGTVARYDTTLPFADVGSYTIFDLSALSGLCKGFNGGVFDGRYVYFVPDQNGSGASGLVVRYDSESSFASAGSFAMFDTETVDSNSNRFAGGVFDGRHVYFVPNNSGLITRFDTFGAFDNAADYTVFDTAGASSPSGGYFGGVFDGRYVYFIPAGSNNGTIARYDTSLSFMAAGSYTMFNTTIVSASSQGFQGGVFDGRYVYLTPYNNSAGYSGEIIRYDTASSFHSVSSYTVFDTTAANAASRGFWGGVYDGRYLYLIPFYQGDYFGSVTRYDTALSFRSAASYTVFNTAAVHSGSIGFTGGVFDGRYIYLAPNNNGASGQITRIDAYPGPQVTAMAADQAPHGFAVGTYAGMSLPNNTSNYNALIVGGNVGIGASAPAIAVDVKGTVYASSWSVARWNTERLGTANNQAITLATGYDQGGFGNSSVGTNKAIGANTATVFDIASIHSSSKKFFGAVFDNRYIYFVPYGSNGSSGYLTRYDTTLPMNAAASYYVYDLTVVHSLGYGFNGGVFDGRYVYLIPNSQTVAVRYDTTRPMNSSGSYAAFDLIQVSSAIPQHVGGAFDGRYVYFAGNSANGGFSGTITRYDTTMSFVSSASYACFDTAVQLSAGAFGYSGAAYDGRYVYFVPGAAIGYTVSSYDTSKPFNQSASWTVFSFARLDASCQGYLGATFDGRYVYFVPYLSRTSDSGTIVRYDTIASFTASDSFTTYDTRGIAVGCAGFAGAAFDGRYVYYAPGSNVPAGTIVRFDTTQPFRSMASYTVFDLTAFGACRGYAGALFDGRYVYFVPFDNGAAFGIAARIDAYPGPLATAMVVSHAPNGLAVGSYAGAALPPDGGLIVSGKIGVGVSDPQYALDVAGTVNASALILTQQTLSNSGGLLGSTANQQQINLAEGDNAGGLGSGFGGANKQMSAQTMTVFDMLAVHTDSQGFFGAVFDGRYIYLLPQGGTSAIGTMTRYDTAGAFNDASSYTTFNLYQFLPVANGIRSSGYYDGRYIYTLHDSSTIVRYDPTLSFTAAGSYVAFNHRIAMASTYPGGFDGRYIYSLDDGGSTLVFRYDTTRSFTALDGFSYTAVSIQAVTGNNQGKHGVAAGQYIYLTYEPGRIVRYDTTKSFTTLSSYTLYNSGLSSALRTAGPYDGRYVYFMQEASNGSYLRYDTYYSFTNSASYTVFSLAALAGGATLQHFGGTFDGRYIYITSTGNPSVSVLRYDTTRSFTAASSYTLFNTGAINSNFRGFRGAIYDGRFIYLIPSQLTGSTWQTRLLRLDAYSGLPATSTAAYQAPNGFAVGGYAGKNDPGAENLIVSGSVGVGTATPAYSLQLAADSAAKPDTSTWTVSSDVRIKRNIEDIPDALRKIRSLRPRQFTYLPEYAMEIGADPGAMHYGFIADEIEGRLEGCVQRSNIHCAGIERLKSLDIHNILIYAVQAVRELSEIVKTQQLQLADRKRRRMNQ